MRRIPAILASLLAVTAFAAVAVWISDRPISDLGLSGPSSPRVKSEAQSKTPAEPAPKQEAELAPEQEAVVVQVEHAVASPVEQAEAEPDPYAALAPVLHPKVTPVEYVEPMPEPAAQITVQDQGAGRQIEQPPDEATVLTLACPKTVDLGRPFLVRLTSTRPLLEAGVHFQGQDITPSISVWNGKHVAMALLGTDALADTPGPLIVAITADMDGERTAFERTVEIRPKAFQTVSLDPAVVPQDRDAKRLAAEREALAKAVAEIGPERFWTLPFERPVAGKIATPYGVARQAGDADLGSHRGLEFLAAPGEDVLACAGGRVVLVADHLHAGRVLVIDHGLGVASLYFHLSATRVTKGQDVQRGQVVGQAMVRGQDGAGPRRLLAVSVLGRMVDPEPLLTSDNDALVRQ